MASEQGKWDKLDNIETKTARYYQGRQIVSKKELTNLWETTPKTIQRYIAKGMPTCEDLWQERFQIFFLDDCEAWKDINVNKSQSLKANKPKTREQEVDIESSGDQSGVGGDDISEELDDIASKMRVAIKKLKVTSTKVEEAERLKTILAGLKTAQEMAIKAKEYIPKKDASSSIVTYVVMLVSALMKDARDLPKECDGKPEEEIRDIMTINSKDILERFKKVIKTKSRDVTSLDLLSDDSMFEVIEATVRLLAKGISASQIMSAIGEL